MAEHAFLSNPKHKSFVHGVRGEPASSIDEIDVVPMINVVFLLLIFFMVVGVFRSASDTNITVPATQTNATSDPQISEPQVLINEQGEFFVNGQTVVRQGILSALQNLASKESLLIKADAKAPANDIALVLQLASDVGFGSAGLQTTNQPSSTQQ